MQISVLFINGVSVFCHWIAGLPWRTGLGWRTGSLEGKPLLRKSLLGEDRVIGGQAITEEEPSWRGQGHWRASHR